LDTILLDRNIFGSIFTKKRKKIFYSVHLFLYKPDVSIIGFEKPYGADYEVGLGVRSVSKFFLNH